MKAKRYSIRQILTAILCVILVAYPCFLEAPVVRAENMVYLSDVKLFYFDRVSQTMSDVREKAAKEGYTIYQEDLNAGTDKYNGLSKLGVFLGYKTTADPNQAIRDIRTLGMDRDYYLYDYNDILAYLKNSCEGTGGAMYKASKTFIQYYKAGSPKAIDAYNGLNLFYVDNAKMKLGDYIVKGKAEIDLFLEITLKASTGTLSAVMNFLNSGIAPFDAKKDTVNWAVALQHSALREKLNGNMTASERSALAKLYDDDAREVFLQIQDFTMHFENASARKDYESTGTIDYTVTNEEGQQVEDYEGAVEAMDTMEEEDGDAVYLSTYEILNQYDYDETRKLGDWLLEIGRQSDEDIDLTELFPLIEAMGEAQSGLVRTLGFISATSNLSQNSANDKMKEVMPEIRQAIKDYNGGDCISLWDNADDDIENVYIAYTSDAIRKSDGNNSIGKKTKFEIVDEKINTVLKWIEIGMGAAIVGCYVLQGVLGLAGTVLAGFTGSAACAAVSAVFSTLVSCLAVAASFLMWAGIFVLAFTIGWAIGKWLGGQIKRAFPTMKHSNMPAYVFDAVDTLQGPLTVKYKTVWCDRKKLGDVNGFEETKWQLICYSKDPNVGSPIVKDSDGNFFKVLQGISSLQNGYDCIDFFGERNPANLNSYTENDLVNGIYFNYRTVQSINGEGPNSAENEPTGGNDSDTYLLDIIVSTAKTAEAAKAKITSKEGKYYVLDSNLSPGTGNYTYIGYSMTTNPDLAITDIRVAPYHGTDSITYGDISYGYAGHLGIAKEDGDNSLTTGDALLKTSDKRAGSPIPTDGLHVITSNGASIQPGWEPVTLFNGLRYNFSAYYEDFTDPYLNDLQIYVSGYSTKKSNNWERENCYLYFEPSEMYTSGTKYLSGFFSIQGYKIDKTPKMVWSQTKANMEELKDAVLDFPQAKLIETNLAQSVQVNMASGHDRDEQYLGFTWTYNPKRAITDIVLFQGDTYQDTVGYSFTRPSGGASIGYIAASTISQQGLDGSTSMKATRFINPNSAIINDHALLVMSDDYDSGLLDGYTKTLAKGFSFSYDKANFLPLGLYMSGPVTGKSPLALSDVIVTGEKCYGKVEGKQIEYHPSSRTYTLDLETKADPEKAYHSVYELKDPYATDPFSISYPNWYDKKGNLRGGTALYIYVKGALPAKAKYISSVTVGSYSRQQYRMDILSKKAFAPDEEVNLIDSAVNASAMMMAVSSCEHEVYPVNLATQSSNAWYRRADEKGKAQTKAPENTPAAYIGITRTDKATKAITAILLYQNNAGTTAAKIKLDGAEYYCDSPSTPIILNGKQYFLYYTRNRGVLTGARVQDIVIDGNVLLQGTATAICSSKGSTTTTTISGLPNYIHMKFEQEEGTYYTDLYIGDGSNRDAALSNLVSQECFQFIDLDLNCASGGNYQYVGYSTGALDMATAKPSTIKMCWEEAIWDIIVTKNEPFHADGFVSEKNGIYYAPVSNVDLNNGVQGFPDELYMYYCCPIVSEDYNDAKKKDTVMPDKVFTAPISKIAMARYDRVPYNTQLNGMDGTGSTLVPWEYVMYADHSAPVDFNAGAFKLNSTGYIDDNRVTMFVQRFDGSIKPAGQITGGFVEESMIFGRAGLE